jgi:hypothetical protein
MRICHVAIVDMIKPAKEGCFAYEGTSGIMGPFHAFKGKRKKMTHMQEPQSMTCGKERG